MNAPAIATLGAEHADLSPRGIMTYRGIVYPWHCDHMDHMNVMWYTGKFDEASWSFLASFGVDTAYLRDRERRMAAVEQTFRYHQELFAGDLVTIESALLEVGRRSLRFRHAMYRGESREVAAECLAVGVHLDARTRRACPLPDDVVLRANRLLGR